MQRKRIVMALSLGLFSRRHRRWGEEEILLILQALLPQPATIHTNTAVRSDVPLSLRELQAWQQVLSQRLLADRPGLPAPHHPQLHPLSARAIHMWEIIRMTL
jgi:hypothetical protein